VVCGGSETEKEEEDEKKEEEKEKGPTPLARFKNSMAWCDAGALLHQTARLTRSASDTHIRSGHCLATIV
jgi:hypothetical protein